MCPGKRCTALSVQLLKDTKTDQVANKWGNAQLSLYCDKGGSHIEFRSQGC